ncbi:hypothetical protein HY991_02155 [Candidatus Micrarchaeota archaeon]|nr:hypothetical protein [Candidatus Micrarchaeota archaeon]
MQRAQSSIEFIIVVGLIVLFISFVLLPGLRESELNLAISSARVGALEYAQEHSLSFAEMNYAIDGKSVVLKPGIATADLSIGEKNELRQRILGKIRDTFSPSLDIEGKEQFSAPNYVYSVQLD